MGFKGTFQINWNLWSIWNLGNALFCTLGGRGSYKRDIFYPQVLMIYLRQQTETYKSKRHNTGKYCEERDWLEGRTAPAGDLGGEEGAGAHVGERRNDLDKPSWRSFPQVKLWWCLNPLPQRDSLGNIQALCLGASNWCLLYYLVWNRVSLWVIKTASPALTPPRQVMWTRQKLAPLHVNAQRAKQAFPALGLRDGNTDPTSVFAPLCMTLIPRIS